MATFLVLISPHARPGDEKARIVRDRFSWLALVFPVLWLLWHRAWNAAALAFAVQALGSAVSLHPAFGIAGIVISIATGLLVSLEGPSMIVAGLERQGWKVDAVIAADDAGTAEAIYYADQPVSVASPIRGVLPAQAPAARPHGPMLGLTGFEEGR